MKHETSLPPVHCRSYYSLLSGIFSPEDLCSRAAAEGAASVGMVDRENFYGLPAFYRAAARYGLKPLAGVEFSAPSSSSGGPAGLPLFTCYPLTGSGFARLNRILTRRAAEETDPVTLLLEEGWDGLRVAVFLPELLPKLLQRSVRGLRAALVYGLPFRTILAAARRYRIPPLALNTALWESGEDRSFYPVLRAIDNNRPVKKDSAALFPPDFRRRASPVEIEAFFSAVPDALYQTRLLAEEGEGNFFSGNYVFPSFQGLRAEEEFVRLRELCHRGIQRRFGRETPDIRRRLDYELNIIRRKGFAGYFLVVHDIVSRCPRTCGRGSSAASIVSYLLGITHVDPLSGDLFFERFLNMGRKDPPDIDVDFPWDERDATLQYVFDTYPGRAGMVADHVTFGSRSAFREAARAYGLPEPDIGPLAEAFRLGESEAPDWLRSAAGRLFGMPRHLGTHPGGVVITPGAITDYTHITTSPLGWPLIAWEKDGTEDAGLVKIDLLGNRSLAVLRDTLDLTAPLRRASGKKALDWEGFDPLEDERTRKMIEDGRTLGVFYIESPATRQLLKKMRRGDYSHLVIASSIIRPAANRYITAFLERLRGAAYCSLHPDAEEVLRESYGIMVYQEDVSRVVMAVCGYSAAEADGLRKVLSKKDRRFSLPSFREDFYRRGRSRRIPAETLDEIWEGIVSFEGYSFCKAHSASYALVSYRLAWLKVRYPLEFFCSVINNGGGFYSRQVYLNAVVREGFQVLPPDINRSLSAYTVERSGEGDLLRAGLSQLKGVSGEFIAALLKERSRRGPFADFQDLLTRLEPSLTDIRGLIRSGCLDSIADGTHRPGLFWHFFHFSRHPELFALPPVPSSVKDYPPAEKLRDQARTLGILTGVHPAELLVLPPSQELPPVMISSRDISDYHKQRVALAAVLVTGKEVRTRTKKDMCFLSFEDRNGIFETVLFPGAYRRLYAAISRGYGFLLSGMVEEEFGVFQIVVDDLQVLELKTLDSCREVCNYLNWNINRYENRHTLRHTTVEEGTEAGRAPGRRGA